MTLSFSRSIVLNSYYSLPQMLPLRHRVPAFHRSTQLLSFNALLNRSCVCACVCVCVCLRVCIFYVSYQWIYYQFALPWYFRVGDDAFSVCYQWISNRSSIPRVFRVGYLFFLSLQWIHNRSWLSSVCGVLTSLTNQVTPSRLTSVCHTSHTPTSTINMKTKVVTLLSSQPISQSRIRGCNEGDSIPRVMNQVTFKGPSQINDT